MKLKTQKKVCLTLPFCSTLPHFTVIDYAFILHYHVIFLWTVMVPGKTLNNLEIPGKCRTKLSDHPGQGEMRHFKDF